MQTTQSFRLIPKYRDKIDVHKICQALIIAAKDMPGKTADPDEKKDAATPET